jgi:hypothetical protein
MSTTQLTSTLSTWLRSSAGLDDLRTRGLPSPSFSRSLYLAPAPRRSRRSPPVQGSRRRLPRTQIVRGPIDPPVGDRDPQRAARMSIWVPMILTPHRVRMTTIARRPGGFHAPDGWHARRIRASRQRHGHVRQLGTPVVLGRSSRGAPISAGASCPPLHSEVLAIALMKMKGR